MAMDISDTVDEPPLGLDDTLSLDDCVCVLRQFQSLTAVLRLAVVSSTFASVARAHLATLETLDLEGCSAVDEAQLAHLLESAPAVLSLQLGGLSSLSIDGSISLPVTLHRIGLSETLLDVSGLIAMWTHLPHLAALDLSDCPALDGHDVEVFVYVPPSSGQLESLSIARCERMSASAVTHLCCLASASLTDVDCSGYDDMRAAQAESLGKACGPILRRLRLNESEAVTDEALVHVASHAARLTASASTPDRYCSMIGTMAETCFHARFDVQRSSSMSIANVT